MTELINLKQEDATLKKEQKTFNKLSLQIVAKKVLLAEFQQVSLEYSQKYHKDLAPILNKHRKQLVQIVCFIDRHYDDVAFSKSDCKKLDSIIFDIAIDLVDEFDEVKQIYARRFGGNLDKAKQIDLELETDINHNDSVHEKTENNFQHKKNNKELGREARQKQETQDINKSIKDVYRQLAKVLHPDLIANDENLECKTSLMKRVNIAYEKQDLLTLLEIQIEIQQISQASMNNLALNKVKHFNKVLKNQLEKLEQEIQVVSSQFIINGMPMSGVANPKSILFALTHDIARTKTMLKELSYDLSLWKQDIRYLKQYIKDMRI